MAIYNDVLKLSDVYLFQQSNTWPLTALGTDITSIVANGVVSNVSYTAVPGNANVTANLTLSPPQFGVVHNISKLGSASYYITANATGLANISGLSSGTTLILNNLTKGNVYNFYAIATVGGSNSLVGLGGTLSPVYTLSGLPSIGTPTYSNVNTGNAFMAVSVPITANTDLGGGAVTYYAVSSPGGLVGASSNSIITVNGLSRGNTYTFTVTANNLIGNTTTSASSSVTPITVAGAPTVSSAVAICCGGTVSFSAPTDTGGSDITGYTAVSSPGGYSACGSAPSISVTGMPTCGSSFTFSVIARNAAGASTSSPSSPSIIPLLSDATFGIFQLGGTAIGGSPGAGTTRNKYTFSNDSQSAATAARINSLGVSAAGNKCVGIFADGGFPSGNTTRDKYTYSNDAVCAATSASVGSNYGAAVGNNSVGIFQLGQGIPAAVTMRNKYTYAGDTQATGTAASAVNYGAEAAGNSTRGIFTLHGPAGGKTRDKYTYSGDTQAAATAFSSTPYTILFCGRSATGNGTTGIFTLGQGYTPAATQTSIREKYTYSNDAAAGATAASTNSTTASGAAGTSVIGIFTLGVPNSPAGTGGATARNKYTYSNDTQAAGTASTAGSVGGGAAANGTQGVNR